MRLHRKKLTSKFVKLLHLRWTGGREGTEGGTVGEAEGGEGARSISFSGTGPKTPEIIRAMLETGRRHYAH